MTSSSRKASRLSACLAWMPCLRGSTDNRDDSAEEMIAVEPQGSILKCGPVKFHNGLRWQKRQLILYKNVLLVSTTKSRDPLGIKYTICLPDLWVAYNQERGRKARSSLILDWDDMHFVVYFGTVERMQRWYKCINRCIDRATTNYLVTIIRKEKEKEKEKEERIKGKRPSLKMLPTTSEDTGNVDEVVVSSLKEGSSEPPSGSQKLQKSKVRHGPATDNLSVKHGASVRYSGLQPFFLLEQMIYNKPGLLSEDQRVIRRHHHTTVWLTEQKQSNIFTALHNVESIAQCCVSTCLCEKPTWSPVLDQNVFEMYIESLWGSGDRTPHEVLLYTTVPGPTPSYF